MTTDTRCCGTGTCLINAEGLCWCGQRWNGDEMVAQNSASNQPLAPEEPGLEAAEIEANQPTDSSRD